MLVVNRQALDKLYSLHPEPVYALGCNRPNSAPQADKKAKKGTEMGVRPQSDKSENTKLIPSQLLGMDSAIAKNRPY